MGIIGVLCNEAVHSVFKAMKSLRVLLPLFMVSPLLPVLECATPVSVTVGAGEALTKQSEDAAQEAAASGDKSKRAVEREMSEAEQAYWDAGVLFFSGEHAEQARGRALLRKAADLEFSTAQDFMGQCLQFAYHGFKQDPSAAVNWYTLAADQGNAYSKVNLGSCLLYGTGTRKDLKRAEVVLREALKEDANYEQPEQPAGYRGRFKEELLDAVVSGGVPVPPRERCLAWAHFLLGECLTARGAFKEAQEEYLVSANFGELGRAGYFDAATKAALNYAYGRGGERDTQKAGELLELRKKLSERQGSLMAASMVNAKRADSFAMADLEDEYSKYSRAEAERLQREIAEALVDKKSKEYNLEEGKRWLELAVDDGQGWAMLLLGLVEAEGADKARSVSLFRQATEKGTDAIAWGNLGICLLNGIGCEKDPAAAAKLFEAHRTKDFLCELGARGEAPATPQTLRQRASLCRRYARKNDFAAVYHLAVLKAIGSGVETNREESLVLLLKAADGGQALAQAEYGLHLEGLGYSANSLELLAKAAGYYMAAAKADEPMALCNLGLLYQRGSGVPTSEDKAASLYERCIQVYPESAASHNNLGLILQAKARRARAEGKTEEADALLVKMRQHFEAADQLGFAMAAYNLGQVEREGIDKEKDFVEAYRHHDDAANRGNITSRVILGEMLERGEGVPVSYSEAAYHYRVAALAGDLKALDRLCLFYRLGLGVSRDLERAAHWLQRGVDRGYAQAFVELAKIRIVQGAGQEAYELLAKVPFMNDPNATSDAQYQLSRLYAGLAGFAADDVQARIYFKMALEAKNKDALAQKGQGLVAEGDLKAALPLLLEAAKAGGAQAMLSLGRLYLKGQGVERDSTRAQNFLEQACRQGLPEAKLELVRAASQGELSGLGAEDLLRYAREAESAGLSEAAALRAQLESGLEAAP